MTGKMKSVIRATVSALFASALMLVSCGSYDDTELKNKVNELENRVAKLESAVNANTQSILHSWRRPKATMLSLVSAS